MTDDDTAELPTAWRWANLMAEEPPEVVSVPVEADFQRRVSVEAIDFRRMAHDDEDEQTERRLKTSEDFLRYYTQPVAEAKNFEGLLHSLSVMAHDLSALDFLSQVAVTFQKIDEHTDTDSSDDGERPVRARCFVHVKEKKRLHSVKFNVTSGADPSSAAVEVVGALRNVFGRGENVSLSLQGDHRVNGGFCLRFAKPLVAGRKYGQPGSLEFDFAFDRVDFGATRPFTERRVLLAASCALLPRHTARWDAVFRKTELKDPNDATLSISTRKNAGLSTKNAVQYCYSRDERDDRALPTAGYLLESTSEIAGLFGDAHHLKQTFKAQHHWSTPVTWSSRPITVSLLAQLAAMFPLGRGRHQTTSRLNDRFFLGGPQDFHGFAYDGVGDRDQSCSVGSEAFGCATVDAQFPLAAQIPAWIFGHAFATVGSTIAQTRAVEAGQLARTVRDNLRWALGFGLVMAPLPNLRTELNVCFGHRARSYDRPVNWEFAIFPDWK